MSVTLAACDLAKRNSFAPADDGGGTALLLVDVINDLDFSEGDQLLEHAMAAVGGIVELKRRVEAARLPVAYVNDNFGQWQSDFRSLGLIITGFAGEFSVLFTAIDACMRHYELHIPADCVASIDRQANVRALALMQSTLRADIRDSRCLALVDAETEGHF